MGREIRRVPPNWEHPRFADGDDCDASRYGKYKPLNDIDFDTALNEWLEGYRSAPDREEYIDDTGGPPDPAYCRPAFTEEPTWWQVYETVSEGTPCSPAFATPEELVRHIMEHGLGGICAHKYSREAAEAFVKQGWAFSLEGWAGEVTDGVEALGRR